MPRRKPTDPAKIREGAQYHQDGTFTKGQWERMQEKKDMHVVRPAAHSYGSDVA